MASHSQASTYPAPGWTLATALKLGRVSNLATVWTNTLAAVLLSAGAIEGITAFIQLFTLILAMSAAYTGGMLLNDAFDREIDAKERPERPIPSGSIGAKDVYLAGFCLLIMSTVLVGLGSTWSWMACGSSLLLNATIVLYNVWHKGNPCSPLIMALCRFLVYITCALAVSNEQPALLNLAALVCLSYVIGLTYTAKQETFSQISNAWPLACLAAPLLAGFYLTMQLETINAITIGLLISIAAWILFCLKLIFRRAAGDVPRAVVSLIAGVALVDALMISIALTNQGVDLGLSLFYSSICVAAFLLTLFLQRYISGT